MNISFLLFSLFLCHMVISIEATNWRPVVLLHGLVSNKARINTMFFAIHSQLSHRHGFAKNLD